MEKNYYEPEGVIDGELLYSCLLDILNLKLSEIDNLIQKPGEDRIKIIDNYVNAIINPAFMEYQHILTRKEAYDLTFGESLNYYYKSHDEDYKRMKEEADLFDAIVVGNIFIYLSNADYTPAVIFSDGNMGCILDIIYAKTYAANPYNNIYKRLSSDFPKNSRGRAQRLRTNMDELKNAVFGKWMPYKSLFDLKRNGLMLGKIFIDVFRDAMMLFVGENPDDIYDRNFACMQLTEADDSDDFITIDMDEFDDWLDECDDIRD